YDANGNVTDLVDTNGSSVAHYEYGPFGQKTTESGTLSASNPFQLSSKYLDAETELYYYGYRFYRPKLGRWINRDPLGDKSFLLRRGQGKSRKERNKLWLQARRPLYMFVENNAINSVDYLGLMGGSGSWSQWCSCKAACGKDACTTAKDAKDGAENDAISITGETGVCWNNSCDAVRHCIWSCEQAKKDTTAAACVTKWHEDWGDANGQTANERTMDDHNNGIGARLASGTAGCKSACKKAWEDNKLITVAP
ncbi:MAG: hypothetical protein EOM12_16450, partial [Verrucomicrobiae bacterium]|nr:hypothetical protein [Verrucomicrobiae bacterium]